MELRQYQIENADKLTALIKEHKMAYFAAEPRTGKTITALHVCANLGAKNALFVTKLKAIPSIQSDAKHYPDIYVDVINFESVSKRCGRYDIVIVDEAHSISAYPKPSKRATDIKKIISDSPVLYLSGTPTPESFSQIYHQLWVSKWSPFKDYNNFYMWARRYVNKKTKHVFGRDIPDYSECKRDDAMSVCGHLIVDYTQKQAGFDVEITERILTVDMDNYQKELIDAILKDKIATIDEGTILADTAVKMQNKVHQLCSGTVIDEDGECHVVSNSKAKFIKHQFEGQQISVFYKFKGEFEVLKTVFDGEWTDKFTEFQSGQKRVFLGQFISSREGIRLDAIIFYNIDFSYLSYAQGKDRIISKERTKPAILYWLFTVGGIEQRIYRAVTQKKDYTNYYFKRDYNVGK